MLAPAGAQERSQAEPPPRILSIVVYGNDACPQPDGDDIVVCARKPENERYRIPKDLRREPVVVGAQGWGSMVSTIEAEARKLLPGSCSVIGSNGQTGCTRAALQQWFAERRMTQQQEAAHP